MPTPAKMIATPNATLNPWVMAASGLAPAACETATDDMIAMPSAPPTWNAALDTPDAMPESRSGTPVSAAIEPATKPAPRPGPNSTMPASMSLANEPGTDSWVRVTQLAATSSRPAMATGRGPNRSTSGPPASIEPTIVSTVMTANMS